MTDLQNRLNAVSGRIQYLKAEKLRIDKEKAELQVELEKAGISDASQLPAVIATKQAEFEDLQEKLADKVEQFEARVAELESRLK